jgi:membrane-associated phospholipid phosphatase
VFYSVTIWPERTVAGHFSLIYSVLPILAYPGLLLLWAILDSSAYPVVALIAALSASIFNELALKPWLREPRPTACPIKNSYGMPSGHSMFACLLLAFLWTYKSSLVLRFCLIVALGPVPWARWHNQDHTERQVVVGSVLGLALGSFLNLFT